MKWPHDGLTQAVGFRRISLRRWQWVEAGHNDWTLVVLWKGEYGGGGESEGGWNNDLRFWAINWALNVQLLSLPAAAGLTSPVD